MPVRKTLATPSVNLRKHGHEKHTYVETRRDFSPNFNSLRILRAWCFVLIIIVRFSICVCDRHVYWTFMEIRNKWNT